MYQEKLLTPASVQVRESPRKRSAEEAEDFAGEGEEECCEIWKVVAAISFSRFFFHREVLSLYCKGAQVSCFSSDTGTLFSHCLCVWVMLVPTFTA